MIRTSLLVALALPLYACNSDPQVSAENASVQDVAKKIEAAGSNATIKPGLWRTTATIEDMSIPGMPAEAAAEMKKMHGQAQSDEKCLTEKDVKRPQEGFFGGQDNCRYERFDMGNGKIDAVMNCSAGGASQKMTLAGTYGSESYDMRMDMQPAGGSEAGMAMKMRVNGKRIGQCTGEEG